MHAIAFGASGQSHSWQCPSPCVAPLTRRSRSGPAEKTVWQRGTGVLAPFLLGLDPTRLALRRVDRARALRAAMTRLLQEEREPSRSAAGIARLAMVAIQTARVRAIPVANLSHTRATMLRGLAAIDAEFALPHPPSIAPLVAPAVPHGRYTHSSEESPPAPPYHPEPIP
jgi:hypothetical protein